MNGGVRSFASVVFASVGLAFAALMTVGATPQPSPSGDTMTSLLAEVHALRLAMEQSASIAPRVQLTLARLNIEEQRIAQLAGQLDQARRELNAAALESKKIVDALTDTERGIQMVTEDKTRRELEFELVQIKRTQSQHAVMEQQARAREADAAQALSTEQSRWIDLNARLDELERLLGPLKR